jgi:hypothetical protein
MGRDSVRVFHGRKHVAAGISEGRKHSDHRRIRYAGAAAVQLFACGADVWAMTQPAKADAVTALGADHIVARRALPTRQFDVVIDLVGPAWPALR